MTTLTLYRPDPAEAQTLAETLRTRGFAPADIALFTAAEAGEAPLTGRLAAWSLAPDAATEKIAQLAEGGALLAVRTTDENREIAKAVLEGTAEESAGDTPRDRAIEAEDPTANLVDIAGQTTKMSHAQ